MSSQLFIGGEETEKKRREVPEASDGHKRILLNTFVSLPGFYLLGGRRRGHPTTSLARGMEAQ